MNFALVGCNDVIFITYKPLTMRPILHSYITYMYSMTHNGMKATYNEYLLLDRCLRDSKLG